jgi:adenylate kinase family enzyme
VHLDVLFYRRGWTLAPKETAISSLQAALARDRWILDGHFLSAGDERFRLAHAVVFLDRSRATCFWRVVKRRLSARSRRRRADLPPGCVEAFDITLLRWIWQYPRVERPLVLELLEGIARGVAIYHLRSDDEVERFLDSL